jgi:prepilin-type N-terminal cleavage/methylation domain-containing protein
MSTQVLVAKSMFIALALMVSLAEPETMPTLVIGSKHAAKAASELIRLDVELKGGCKAPSFGLRRTADAGFTLIELLVAIAIMAIVLGVAVLAIPNHDERYWKDNLDQLVSSLNLAQEESAMSGTPMIAQIDSAGWRFFVPNISGVNGVNGVNGANSSNMSGGQGISLTGNSAVSPINNLSGLMPDVYRPQTWYKPVEIAPLQLTLGSEQVAQVLQIPIKQVSGNGAQVNSSDTRQAVLIRNRNGRFSWTKL